jgi:HD domain
MASRSSALGHGSDHTSAPGQTELGRAEKKLLAEMPLHAITSVHGEAGLRERLTIEIADLPEVDRERIEQALALATKLHATDRRQREPYVNHLLRVAIRIFSHYQVRDADVVCAALLHDSVEDHAGDLVSGGNQAAALAVLSRQFGNRVAELVGAVTNPIWAAGRDEHEQYRAHAVASLEANPWARVIKVSDFTDNAVGLIHTTGPKLEKLAAKYSPLIPALRELIIRPDTPLDGEVKRRIVAQLDSAARGLASVQSHS